MKPVESNIIEVRLTVLDNMDVLVFMLDLENPKKYVINLNDQNSQAQIKEVFAKLLEMLLKMDLALELKIEDGYSKGLYKDVCSEYISELNKEIAQTKIAIMKTLE